MWYVHTMEHYSGIKRSKLALTVKTTAQMTLRYTIVSEISQRRKNTYYMLPFLQNFRNNLLLEQKE